MCVNLPRRVLTLTQVLLGGELETLVAAAAASSAAVSESEAAAAQKIAQSAFVIQAGLKLTLPDTTHAAAAVTWTDVASVARRNR